MANTVRKVNSRGQVTVPAEIRRDFDIRPGEAVVFEIVDGVITMDSVRARLMRAYGSIPPLDPSKTWKEIREAAWEEHVQHIVTEEMGR